VSQIQSSGSHKERKRKLGVLLSSWWMIWKERNRRIFKNKGMSASSLAHLAMDEIRLQQSVLLHDDG
jgi:hypothetical protein